MAASSEREFIDVIYMLNSDVPVLDKAFKLAAKYCIADRRNGDPAMVHVKQVAFILRDMGFTKTQDIVVAILHDVVEDCHDDDPHNGRIYRELLEFGQYVYDNVMTLTHPPNEPYEDYINRIVHADCATPIAVKIADIIDNVTSEPLAVSKESYRRALPRLINAMLCFCEVKKWD